MLKELGGPKKLILQYLDGCTIACSHCITSSAPGLKPKLPLDTAKKIMKEAADADYREVNITGGEPFLVYGELRELIRHAKTLNLIATVTSNAFWAASLEKAKEKLTPLKEDGLDKIHLSYDRPHHEQGIPVAHLENGLQAAQDIGLATELWFTFLKNDTFMEGLKRDFEKYNVPFRLTKVVPMGRGASIAKDLLPRFDAKGLTAGCNTYHFLVIVSNGNSYACCNAAVGAHPENPLSLGNIDNTSFQGILRRKEKLLLHEMISYFGPKTLYNLLPSSLRKGLVLNQNPCHFCTLMLNDGRRAKYLLRKINVGEGKLSAKRGVLELMRKENLKTQKKIPLLKGYRSPQGRNELQTAMFS